MACIGESVWGRRRRTRKIGREGVEGKRGRKRRRRRTRDKKKERGLVIKEASYRRRKKEKTNRVDAE